MRSRSMKRVMMRRLWSGGAAPPAACDRSLSVADWVQEEAILSLPAMPLHDDCEMDYENTSDEVVEAEKPNPFAALAALKH